MNRGKAKKIVKLLSDALEIAVGETEYETAAKIRELKSFVQEVFGTHTRKGEQRPQSIRQRQNIQGMRSTHQRAVDTLMEKARQNLPDVPSTPNADTLVLRAKLMLEEVLETIINGLGIGISIYNGKERFYLPMDMGLGSNWKFEFNLLKPFDMVETIDGCCDVRVVTTGTLSACGIPDVLFQEEVDANNLAKFGPGGYRREDGKWIKPPGHKPPRIAQLLDDLNHAIKTEQEQLNIQAAEDSLPCDAVICESGGGGGSADVADESPGGVGGYTPEELHEMELTEQEVTAEYQYPSVRCPYCNAVTIKAKARTMRKYECGSVMRQKSDRVFLKRSDECKKRMTPKHMTPTPQSAKARNMSNVDLTQRYCVTDAKTDEPVKGRYVVLRLDDENEQVQCAALMAARQFKKLLARIDGQNRIADIIDQTV